MDEFLHLLLNGGFPGVDTEEVLFDFIEKPLLPVFQREKVEACEFGR